MSSNESTPILDRIRTAELFDPREEIREVILQGTEPMDLPCEG